MEITEQFYSKDKVEWREWLQQHNQSKNVIWLIFYKKHTHVPCIAYDDAVEETICFGWIDSIVKRIDEKKYGQKFTPRKSSNRYFNYMPPSYLPRAEKQCRFQKLSCQLISLPHLCW